MSDYHDTETVRKAVELTDVDWKRFDLAKSSELFQPYNASSDLFVPMQFQAVRVVTRDGGRLVCSLADYWILRLNHWILTLIHWILTLNHWILRLNHWILRLNHWILRLNHWILRFNHWILRFISTIWASTDAHRIQWFNLGIQWFNLRIQWFNLRVQWFNLGIQWFNLRTVA